MRFLENIKNYFAVRSINKALASQNRQSYYPDFKSIKSILILFKSEEDEKNSFIREIIADLKSQGKKVTVWGYLDKKKTETAVLPDFRLFGNNETTYYNIPQPLLTDEFRNSEYDMVMQIANTDIFPLDYLLAQARSPFKVSKKKPYKGIADFMIEVDESADEAFLFNQILFYLNNIQAKN